MPYHLHPNTSSVHRSSHQLTTTFLAYLQCHLKDHFVLKSDVKQWFTTTTTSTTTSSRKVVLIHDFTC